MSKAAGKRVLKAFILTLACVAFDFIYALFGHGVRSASMDLMFLYPLAGGLLPCLILGVLGAGSQGKPDFGRFWSVYCAGLATLTIGACLAGVFEIAGTNSNYLIFYTICGWALTSIGAAGIVAGWIASAKGRRRSADKA
jgi:hypothetical protein